MELNSREVAILIWIVFFLAFSHVKARQKGLSLGFLNVVKAFFKKDIIKVLVIALAWIVLCLLVMAQVGLWRGENVKVTVWWFLGFAFIRIFNLNDKELLNEESYLISYLKAVFALSVIISFIAGAFTLPLYLELFLVPLIFLFSAVEVFAKHNSDYKPAQKVAHWLIVLIAFIYIIYSLVKITSSPNEFFLWVKFFDLLVPVLLSITFIPYMMLLRTYVAYENVFRRIGFWMQDDKLFKYLKFKAIMRFDFDIQTLQSWKESLEFKKTNIVTKKDVDASIDEAIKLKIMDFIRVPVPKEKGWNPFEAKDFLKSHGLPCDQYRPIYQGWGADSKPLKFKIGSVSSIDYLVSGCEESATNLKIKLFVCKEDDESLYDESFSHICAELVYVAATEVYEELVNKIVSLEDMNVLLGCWEFSMKHESFKNGSYSGYERFFEIKIIEN